MSPPKRQKLDDSSIDEMLEELAEGRAKVAKDVTEYTFNKNRVRLLAGNEGEYFLQSL